MDKDLSFNFSLCKIPEEAYFLFPKYEDQISIHPKQNRYNKRNIFAGNVEFIEYEEKKLDKLDQMLSESNLLEQINEFFDRPEKLRFLQGNDYNAKKTVKDIIATTEFRKSLNYPSNQEAINFIVNSGIVYIHGRDHMFRPIIIYRPDLFQTNRKKYSVYEFQLSMAYFLDSIIHEMLIPGQVENWVVICDIGLLLT